MDAAYAFHRDDPACFQITQGRTQGRFAAGFALTMIDQLWPACRAGIGLRMITPGVRRIVTIIFWVMAVLQFFGILTDAGTFRPIIGGITRMMGTDPVKIAIGNDKLMEKLGVDCIPCHCVGTILHIAIDGKYAGHIVISDIEKPDARAAIAALKRTGVQKTVMLTGDTKRVAEQVAKDLGVDEVHSELLPADKVTQVEKLLAEKSPKAKLAFVGDGINDAPVLSRADIGIAMGAMGSDAAIEAADVVLMDDDPMKIAKGIQISRKCLRIVYENIVFALGVKALCLVLGALGLANMWAAIFADVGVMVLAVLNAIRALRTSKN